MKVGGLQRFGTKLPEVNWHQHQKKELRLALVIKASIDS
jgi:hypothetical protein